MEDRIIIGEVVEETPMGNPVCIIFIDPACKVVNYSRLLVMPRIQGKTIEDAEIVRFDACLN